MPAGSPGFRQVEAPSAIVAKMREASARTASSVDAGGGVGAGGGAGGTASGAVATGGECEALDATDGDTASVRVDRLSAATPTKPANRASPPAAARTIRRRLLAGETDSASVG